MTGVVLLSALGPEERPLRAVLQAQGLAVATGTAAVGEDVAVLVHGGEAEGLEPLGRRHPEAARVWVCEPQAGLGTLVRGVGAHEVLLRPMRPEAVTSVVRRAREVHWLLSDPTLRRHSEAFGALPAVPVTYQRLCQVVGREGSSTLDVAEVVGRDMAVTTRMLAVVNSAVFRLPRRISGVREAVGLLGLDTVRDLVLSVEVLTCLGRGAYCGQLEKRQQLAHARASLARMLAPRPLADTAFTTGLLADVGMMLVAARSPEHLKAIEAERLAGATAEEAERRVLGLTSHELGARLLALWGLPGDVVAAVLAPRSDEPIAQLVALASTFVDEAVHEAQGEAAVEWVTPEMVEPWGLERRVDLARHLARGLVRGCVPAAA